MADDVGTWNLSAYHRGMMGGSTPNIDRIAREGALFTDYYGQQSCTGDAPRSLPARLLSARAC
jgi:arylsulfatase